MLVPLDGSDFAEEAIPLALSIANRAGASLELLRVHELYLRHDPHGCWAIYQPAEDAEFRAKEQAYLDLTVKRLQVHASIPVTSVLVDGLIEDAILRRVHTRLPDLIVMATHGRGPLSRLLFGSLAERLSTRRIGARLAHAPREHASWPKAKAGFQTNLDTIGRIETSGTCAEAGNCNRKPHGGGLYARSNRRSQFTLGRINFGGGTRRSQ